jgi:dTDP-4-dehydrorhamnose 3,5-epimerase
VIFIPTKLKGAWVIEPERHEDERGFFARTWCETEFAAHGLEGRWVQSSVSFNRTKGTLRGLHYQRAPYEEVKLVRCTRGSIFDVIVDLRPDSPDFKRHLAVVLTATDGRALYVPQGFAHGFQTLEDDTEVLYCMSQVYVPEAAAGVRWNDHAFGIMWPDAVRTMSERDRGYPDFLESEPAGQGSGGRRP